MTILIVEDDPLSLKVLQITLEKLGHEVAAARNGNEAWKAFEKNPARVMVSDWMMPGMDGLDLCRKVRARRAPDYTYFILLTARGGNENWRQAMEAGVDDFLTKPLNHDELLVRLRVAERIVEFTTQIRQLKALVPICAYCKKIRDDQEYWQEIESYVHSLTGADFSHGVCPACYEKHVQPQLKRLEKKIAIQKKATASGK